MGNELLGPRSRRNEPRRPETPNKVSQPPCRTKLEARKTLALPDPILNGPVGIPVYKINKRNALQRRLLSIVQDGEGFYLKYGDKPKQKHRFYTGCGVEDATTSNKKLQATLRQWKLQLEGWKLIVIRDKTQPTETRPMSKGYVNRPGWPFICRAADVEKV